MLFSRIDSYLVPDNLFTFFFSRSFQTIIQVLPEMCRRSEHNEIIINVINLCSLINRYHDTLMCDERVTHISIS